MALGCCPVAGNHVYIYMLDVYLHPRAPERGVLMAVHNQHVISFTIYDIYCSRVFGVSPGQPIREGVLILIYQNHRITDISTGGAGGALPS